MAKITTKNLSLSEIRIDGGTQPRTEINEQYIRENLIPALDGGATMPPLTVFYDGKYYWLADGFHRWHAFTTCDVLMPACEVHKGTKRDAILYSVGVNDKHGLRRTNEDKRECVETLLNDKEWAKWTDVKIAEQCNVGHAMVSRVRVSIFPKEKDRNVRTATRGGKTYQMDIKNIGSSGANSAGTEATVTEDEYEPPTDGLGDPITDARITQVFDDIPKLKAIIKMLGDARAAYRLIASDGVTAEIVDQQIEIAIKDAQRALKFGIPWCLVPDGVTDKKLKRRGWLTKEQHKRLPQQMRWK